MSECIICCKLRNCQYAGMSFIAIVVFHSYANYPGGRGGGGQSWSFTVNIMKMTKFEWFNNSITLLVSRVNTSQGRSWSMSGWPGRSTACQTIWTPQRTMSTNSSRRPRSPSRSSTRRRWRRRTVKTSATCLTLTWGQGEWLHTSFWDKKNIIFSNYDDQYIA